MNASFRIDYIHQIGNESEVLQFYGSIPSRGVDDFLWPALQIMVEVGQDAGKQLKDLNWGGVTPLLNANVRDHLPPFHVFESLAEFQKNGSNFIASKISQFMKVRKESMI